MIWEQAQAGCQVEVWTIFAGDPPPGPLSPFAQELHERWQIGAGAMAARRAEDAAACRRLGASVRHFGFLDSIYRRDPQSGEPLAASVEQLYTPLPAADLPLVTALKEELARALAEKARLVSPLTIGGHRDHRLARAAAEALRRPLWLYADYPYIANQPAALQEHLRPDWQTVVQPISPEGLRAWQEAAAHYSSQTGSFWDSEQEMRDALVTHWQTGNGGRLWSFASLKSVLY